MKIEPGCLAVIVRNKFPENLGHIVTVIGLSPEASIALGYPAWKIECPSPLRSTVGRYVTVGYIEEACLRPISGPSIAKHVQLWDELPSKVNA